MFIDLKSFVMPLVIFISSCGIFMSVTSGCKKRSETSEAKLESADTNKKIETFLAQFDTKEESRVLALLEGKDQNSVSADPYPRDAIKRHLKRAVGDFNLNLDELMRELKLPRGPLKRPNGDANPPPSRPVLDQYKLEFSKFVKKQTSGD